MVSVDNITDEDYVKSREIFNRAEALFGWTREDSYKVVVDNKEYVLFGYHPVFMLFGYDKDGKLFSRSCLVDNNNKVISITIEGYQINITDNMIYLIDEYGRHQSVQLLKNENNPDFEVSANGLLTYMQYDSKKDVRLVTRYDQNVYGNNGRVYSDYLGDPFYVSVETNPIKRDKGLFFLGSKNAYYRLDFDVWNNKWQYDLATMGEYGISAVMAKDTITLHDGEKEFSRYYREILSCGDYFSLTTFPFGKQYKKENIQEIIESLSFNSVIPSFIVDLFNTRESLSSEFQAIIDILFQIRKTK